jgi:accessory gene regulator B
MKKLINKVGSELGYNQEKIAVANYGFQTIVFSVVGTLIVLVIAFFLKIVHVTMFALFSAALLRNFSGGAHCSSPVKCLVLTCVIFSLLGFLADIITPEITKYLFLLSLLVFSFSLISIVLLAPVDTPNKPITSPLHKKQLKIISLVVILILFILEMFLINNYKSLATAVLLGVLWQSLMLWPLGIALIKKYDDILRF